MFAPPALFPPPLALFIPPHTTFTPPSASFTPPLALFFLLQQRLLHLGTFCSSFCTVYSSFGIVFSSFVTVNSSGVVYSFFSVFSFVTVCSSFSPFTREKSSLRSNWKTSSFHAVCVRPLLSCSLQLVKDGAGGDYCCSSGLTAGSRDTVLFLSTWRASRPQTAAPCSLHPLLFRLMSKTNFYCLSLPQKWTVRLWHKQESLYLMKQRLQL